MSDKTPKSTINPPVFFISGGLLVLFVAFGVLMPKRAASILPAALDWVSTQFGWLYVMAVAFFVVFSLWLMLSRYSSIRLGDDDERPEFSRGTWFAMLFSAGMGIGLVFYGVAEPMMHYATPPGNVDPASERAAQQALPITFFHWGLHAWAIYALMGLSIAYFAYRKKLPLSLRSCFYPLLGERIHGWPGHVIDILAVFGTLFGLATSLGLGAMQVSAGLHYLFGVAHNVTTQLVLIAVITLAATTSLVTGVKKGIRRLSELNLILAGLLMLFVLIVGPTLFIIDSLVENTGRYLTTVFTRTFHLVALNDQDAGWMKSWTLFYWGWWIAWSPFVGMFVARISRGRTIREFILGVLLVPTAVTFVWFSVFGGSALHMELFGGGGIADAVASDVSTAIFVMLHRLPLAGAVSFLAACVVTVFFVTSSDSASFVVDMLTSGGHPNPPVWQRIFWALAEGVCAAVLLYAGGSQALSALQAAVVTIGLPFCIVLIAMCFGLLRSLREEADRAELEVGPRLALAGIPSGFSTRDVTESERSRFAHAVRSVAQNEERTLPATSVVAPSEGAPSEGAPSEGNAEPRTASNRPVAIPQHRFARILVPTDYSEHSLRALGFACQLADRLGEDAHIDVLHVTPPPVDYLPIDEWIWGESREPQQVEGKLKEAAHRALEAYTRSLPQSVRSRVRIRLEIGVPYRVILAAANSGDYDLLVLGTHGGTASQQVRLGSVAERIVRFAPCTVITVR
jgi:choline/glycine/proline betaine transport protein